MTLSNLLIAIIRANPGIVVQNSEMNDIVRDVWRETGVIIGTKRAQDYYDHPFHYDYDNDEPRQMFRNNPRKFSLYIQNEHT